MKLLRNNLLESGYILGCDQCMQHSAGNEISQTNNCKKECGKMIRKSDFEKLIVADSQTEVKCAFKLNSDLLNIKGGKKMKVYPAAKLFSSQVGLAMKALLGDEVIGNFVLKINNWFDVMNSLTTSDKITLLKNGFGLYLSEQMTALDSMIEVVRYMRKLKPGSTTAKKQLLPFQQGIIISVSALKYLYMDLHNTYDSLSYLLTRRLCQDPLENYFGKLR